MGRPRLTLPCLALALSLAACSGPKPDNRAEEEALRQRVERLEREDKAERERLAGEVRALRQELEGLRRGLEEPPADRGAAPEKPGQEQQRSPRQALKESLKGFVDMTRQTLDRLSRELDESLVRPPAQEKGQEKGPDKGPDRKPAPPPAAGPGTQI